MIEPVSGTHLDSAELQSYADGESLAERIAAHIESCGVCREEVTAVRRVTAALSLGSTPPDSLTDRIRARRGATTDASAVTPLRRSRSRVRTFVLPVGLAAAAALTILLPRARREPTPDAASPSGAKGVLPVDTVVLEAVISETGRTSIDSALWDVGPGMAVELRYVTGLDESPRAEQLAARVAARLREEGVDSAAITVNPVTPHVSRVSLPPGAVGVTVRSRVLPGAP